MKLTQKEIEVVAEAMWDCDYMEDDRPRWKDLDVYSDEELMREFMSMAEQGINKYLELKLMT